MDATMNIEMEPSPELWDAGGAAVVLAGLAVDQTGNILDADQGGDIFPDQAP